MTSPMTCAWDSHVVQAPFLSCCFVSTVTSTVSTAVSSTVSGRFVFRAPTHPIRAGGGRGRGLESGAGMGGLGAGMGGLGAGVVADATLIDQLE